MKRKFLKNPFHQANMFYNQEQDFFVCPMGHHMEHVAYKKTVSHLVDEAKRNSGGAFRQLIITLYNVRNRPFWVGFLDSQFYHNQQILFVSLFYEINKCVNL